MSDPEAAIDTTGDSGRALRLEGIRRYFEQGGTRLDILRGIDLSIQAGEAVALVGPSGAGKSTLLHIAGLLETPTAGRVAVDGRDVSGLSDRERTAVRRAHIGFVYQFHHLLPEFSALENIMLPQMIAGQPRQAAKVRGRELLDQVGLADRAEHRPARLSGGEQQRVAIVRALANRPTLLLADEPTGNLDEATADHVFAILRDLVRSEGVGAMIATHNLALARRMDRTLTLHDGLLSTAGR